MAGEKRKKSSAGSSVSRRGSRTRASGRASRSAATGNRERRNASKASKARVIKFPQGRRPRRSRLPDRRKDGARFHNFGGRPVPRNELRYREGHRYPIPGRRAGGGGRSSLRGARRRRWNRCRDRGKARREERRG